MDLQTYKGEKWAQGMVTACIVHSSPETGGKQGKDSSKKSSAFAVLGTLQTYSSLWVFVLALPSAWGTLTPDLRMYCSIPPWRHPLFQRYFLRESFPSWIKITPPIIFKPSLCFALNYLTTSTNYKQTNTLHSTFLTWLVVICSLYENSSSCTYIIFAFSICMLHINKKNFKKQKKNTVRHHHTPIRMDEL